MNGGNNVFVFSFSTNTIFKLFTQRRNLFHLTLKKNALKMRKCYFSLSGGGGGGMLQTILKGFEK